MSGQTEELPAISSLLPHSGDMCLLDSVHAWNRESIECRTRSHLKPDNPLRSGDQLPVQAGIEYAAQAMAVHGTLGEKRAGKPRIAYLAVLSRVQWFCSRLDDLPGELRVAARQLAASEGGFSYGFQLLYGERCLLEGQALVALQDE